MGQRHGAKTGGKDRGQRLRTLWSAALGVSIVKYRVSIKTAMHANLHGLCIKRIIIHSAKKIVTGSKKRVKDPCFTPYASMHQR